MRAAWRFMLWIGSLFFNEDKDPVVSSLRETRKKALTESPRTNVLERYYVRERHDDGRPS